MRPPFVEEEPIANVKPLPGKWLGFTPDTNEQAAKSRFLEKYGYEASQVHRPPALLLVGPIREATLNGVPPSSDDPHKGS
jgi:hypothetical protein